MNESPKNPTGTPASGDSVDAAYADLERIVQTVDGLRGEGVKIMPLDRASFEKEWNRNRRHGDLETGIPISYEETQGMRVAYRKESGWQVFFVNTYRNDLRRKVTDLLQAEGIKVNTVGME